MAAVVAVEGGAGGVTRMFATRRTATTGRAGGRTTTRRRGRRRRSGGVPLLSHTQLSGTEKTTCSFFRYSFSRLVALSIHSLHAGGTTDRTLPQQWLRYPSLMQISQKLSAYFHSEGLAEETIALLSFYFSFLRSYNSFQMNYHLLPKLDTCFCSLGGHTILKIGCEFILPRLHNFHGTGGPDSTIPSDFLADTRLMYSDNGSTSPNGAPSMRARSLMESSMRARLKTMQIRDNLSAIDILSACNLVNYFGKMVLGSSGVGKITLYLILIRKH